jgi:hypothetical protein
MSVFWGAFQISPDHHQWDDPQESSRIERHVPLELQDESISEELGTIENTRGCGKTENGAAINNRKAAKARSV